MTATDELRRLLDERGIEHMDFNMPERSLTLFAGDEHDGAYTENSVDTILTVYGASPEQAVEATLGSDLKAENAKLRELVRHLYVCMEHYEANGSISCESCPFDNDTQDCDFERRMAELGMEVDA